MNSFSKNFARFTMVAQKHQRTFSKCAGAILILAALFSAGCKSLDKPASAGFASVVIYNQSLAKIHEAANTVFANNGYKSVRLDNGGQVYEKEATKGEQIAYAGFVGAHEGERTIVRVRMGIQPAGANACLLDCKAWVVTNPGSFVNEESYALFGFQSGPYQDLLNAIRDNLKVAATSQQ
jgi:hypothetical protein